VMTLRVEIYYAQEVGIAVGGVMTLCVEMY
jgi:hypothetical protein